MADFDASTPQLRAVKNWIDAYRTLDMKNVEPLISKDFQYQTLPDAIDLPKEETERHLERYRELFSALTKVEVRIQHGEPPSSSQTDTHRPSPLITK